MRFAIPVTMAALAALFASACSPYPKVPLAPPLSYAEGEEALARGQLPEAEQKFRAYLESEGSSYRARARYQLARTQYQMEDYAAAEASLDDLDAEFPNFGQRQVAALRGDIAYALGEPVDAILLWEKAYKDSNTEERIALEPRIAEAMRSLDTEQATAIAAAVTEPAIYEMAMDRVAGPSVEVAAVGELAVLPPDGEPAPGGAPATVMVVDEAPEPEVEDAGMLGELTVDEQMALDMPAESEVVVVAPEAAPAQEEIAVASVETVEPIGEDGASPAFHVGPRVAALLPLTGEGRDAGARALVSMRNSIDAATLMIRDTGSDPATAVELIRQLAANPDVIAVLGPMLPPVIAAVRREAGALDLPILPLPTTGVRPVPQAGGTSPSQALAQHAVRNLGVARVGILAPDTTAGAAFATAAKEQGATIVGTLVYNPDDVDLNAVLIAVQTWIDDGGIDAVYVADVAPRAIQLAKAARATAPKVVLLGDAGWNDAAALAADAPAIEGAIIAGEAMPPVATSAPATTPEEVIPRAAASLQRAIALGETDRSQTRSLLAEIYQQEEPQQTVRLMKIVGGRPVAIQ